MNNRSHIIVLVPQAGFYTTPWDEIERVMIHVEAESEAAARATANQNLVKHGWYPVEGFTATLYPEIDVNTLPTIDDIISDSVRQAA